MPHAIGEWSVNAWPRNGDDIHAKSLHRRDPRPGRAQSRHEGRYIRARSHGVSRRGCCDPVVERVGTSNKAYPYGILGTDPAHVALVRSRHGRGCLQAPSAADPTPDDVLVVSDSGRQREASTRDWRNAIVDEVKKRVSR